MIEINTLGDSCPLPLLKFKKALKQYPNETNFFLKSSDANSQIDLKRYCEIHSISIEMKDAPNGEYHYLLERLNNDEK